jgi:hypothetical protein
MTYPDLLHPGLAGLLIALKLGILAFAVSSVARRVIRTEPARMAVGKPSRNSRRRR